MSVLKALAPAANAGGGGEPAIFVGATAIAPVTGNIPFPNTGPPFYDPDFGEGDIAFMGTNDDTTDHAIQFPDPWTPLPPDTSTFPNAYFTRSMYFHRAWARGPIDEPAIYITAAIDAGACAVFRNMGDPTGASYVLNTGSDMIYIGSMNVEVDGSTIVVITSLDDDDATISQLPPGYTLASQAGQTGGSIAILYQLDVPAGTTDVAIGYWSSPDDLIVRAYVVPPL